MDGCVARALHLPGQFRRKGAAFMETKCEVIGWLLVDDDRAQVLVREEDGHLSQQAASPEATLGQHAIQTGVFRRGNPIVDPVTRETLGYEMEPVSSLITAVA
jgi:hypothetical protein